MRYSIGDVSRLLGITTSALHFYEKEGIIDTPKVESGRRYYQEEDVTRLISVKKYRAMGVPVRDIAKQFSRDGMTGAQVLARIRQKRVEAERMMAFYRGLLQDMDQLIDSGEEALKRTGVVDIRYAEEMCWLPSDSGGRVPSDKDDQMIARQWLDFMPAVSVSICWEQQTAQPVFTLIISAERAADVGIDVQAEYVRRIPGGMALHAIVECDEKEHAQPDRIFRPLQAFAREHRFVQKETMWARLIFADCSGGGRRYFYDTYMLFDN